MLPAFTEPVFNIALHCIQLHFHQLHCTDNNQTDKIWVTKIIQALWAPTSGRASWFREHLICSHIRWVFGTNEPTDKAVLWVGGRAVLRLPPLFCLGYDYFWSSFQSKNVYLTAECMNKFILILLRFVNVLTLWAEFHYLFMQLIKYFCWACTNIKSGWIDKYKNWTKEKSVGKSFANTTAELKKLKVEKMSAVEKAQVDHTGHLVEELLSQVLMNRIMVMNVVLALMNRWWYFC